MDEEYSAQSGYKKKTPGASLVSLAGSLSFVGLVLFSFVSLSRSLLSVFVCLFCRYLSDCVRAPARQLVMC
jgi:hypothetical protein